MKAIQEIEQIPQIDVSKSKLLPQGMRVHRFPEVFHFKMAATTPFAPSAYGGGTGGEDQRQGILLSIKPEDFASLALVEKEIQNQLSEMYPKLSKKWISGLKESAEYPPQVRAKINLSGPRACRFFDEAGKPTVEAPQNWRNLGVNVVLRVSGVYVQAKNAGLILDITHLQPHPATTAQTIEMNPFAPMGA